MNNISVFVSQCKRRFLVPALMYDDLRLYPPSMDASKDRMVSNGRSRRGRVGFDRSGSAGKSSVSLHLPYSCNLRTYDVSLCVAVLEVADAFHSRIL